MSSFSAHERPGGQESGLRGVPAVPGTLNQLFRMAALTEARPAVLLRPGGGGWRPLSDERFGSRVTRLALYLREILEIGPGDRVVVVSEPRHEWLLADLAAMSLGAMSVAIEPGLQGTILERVIRDTDPRVVFASGSVLQKLRLTRGHLAPLVPVIGLDGGGRADGPIPLATAIDVAGALDTAGRTRALLKAAWEVAPDVPCCCHYVGYLDGHVECVELTQGEAFERVMRYWTRPLARAGERLYLAGPEVTLNLRLALYAALGDGHSTLVFGTPGRELEEIAVLGPSRIVGPPVLFEEADTRSRALPRPRLGELGSWVGGTLRRAVMGRIDAEQQDLRVALGGRVRWVVPTEALATGTAARLGAIVALGPTPSPGSDHGARPG